MHSLEGRKDLGLARPGRGGPRRINLVFEQTDGVSACFSITQIRTK